MLSAMLSDVVSVLRATFFTGDLIALLIAFGSALLAALIMRRGGQIGSMTLLALVLYALGGYLRGVFAGPTPQGGAVSGGRLAGQLEASWGVFMGLTAATLLAYFIAFMLVIVVLYSARKVLSRG